MPEQSSLIVPEGFVAECRSFLDAHARPRPGPEAWLWGEGPDELGGSRVLDPGAEQAWISASRAWRRTEFDNGYGWLGGPQVYGGRGLALGAERIYRDLREHYEVPRPDPFVISLGMVAPAILRHATTEVRDQYLRGLYRGDLLGCQLFSEPGAGSDLAALTTRAVLAGDEWVVTGQKVWTSLAHHADVGLLLCRTDPAGPKHAGITAFIVDMRAPGVDVRPLTQMTGGHEFNEVFFDDVRIPDGHRLGEVGGGWHVATTTLMGERALGVGRDVFGLLEATRRLVRQVEETGDPTDPLVRQRVAASWIDARVIELNGMRSEARLRAGLPPGPEESITKIGNTEAMRRLSETAGEILGAAMVVETGEWSTTTWANWTMHTAGCRIAAGTDEVMRNILAERVLGLPKDPAVA